MAESRVHTHHMVFHFPSYLWLSHINNHQDMTHTKISELIVFIHILPFLFGLQHKLLFSAITQEKSKESFPIGDIFSRTLFVYMQPLTSFVSYPALDNKVAIRFLKTEGRGGGSWFLLLLKYQCCPKYDL